MLSIRNFLVVSALCIFCFSTIIRATTSTTEEKFTTYHVKPNDTIKHIVSTQLRMPSYLHALLEYNDLTSSADIKAGMTLKIPYSLSKKRYARIIHTKGNVVKKAHAQSSSEELKINSTLEEQNIIKTDKKSKAIIECDDGSRIRLVPKTDVKIDVYKYEDKKRKTNIKIKQGGIYAKINHLTHGNTFTFQTAMGKVKVTPSVLHINIDKKRNIMLVAVKTGSVKVKGKSKTVEVKSGYATVVSKDGDPLKPYKYNTPAYVEWIN